MPAPSSRSFIDRSSALLVAVAAALWASDNYFRPQLVAHHLTGSQIVLVEDLLISVCFLPMLFLARREVRSLGWRTWLAVAVIAVGPQAVATVLFTDAFTYAFPRGAAPNFNVQVEIYLLYLLQPVFGLAFARVLLRERRRPRFWPLALVAMASVYFIVFPQDPLAPFSKLGQGQLAAGVLVLGAVTLWAAGTVLGRYALRNVSFTTTTGMRFVLALPVLLVIMLVDTGPAGFGQYRLADLPSLVGLALIPGLVAMTLYYRGLSSTPASLATLAELAFPATLFLIYTLPAPVGLALPLQSIQVMAAIVLAVAVTALNLLKDRNIVEVVRPHDLRPAVEPI
ncbi:MAG: DMT family transporter [Candidatus Dormibacteraeota bacterium]|uniref:DMT family transporter n=1 Tax=Candidatus Amunia macphersoniae TaxID=3127014 RepID=A0A934NFJ4_9BACT|nr:DMT family transporter [Candidatus Dormibacteraeota bacterium]